MNGSKSALTRVAAGAPAKQRGSDLSIDMRVTRSGSRMCRDRTWNLHVRGDLIKFVQNLVRRGLRAKTYSRRHGNVTSSLVDFSHGKVLPWNLGVRLMFLAIPVYRLGKSVRYGVGPSPSEGLCSP